MKTAIIINLAAYQKENCGANQQGKIAAPVSSELALAIQQLIQRLRESNPLKPVVIP